MNDVISGLIRSGKLSRQKAGFSQVEGMLRAAIDDLEEAKKVRSVSGKATYLMAYNAMLKAGRALLLQNGLRPDDGEQHKTVVDATGSIMGSKYKELIIQFDVMRRKRNEFTYGAMSAASGAESSAALSDSVELIKWILKEIRKTNPQMSFDWE